MIGTSKSTLKSNITKSINMNASTLIGTFYRILIGLLTVLSAINSHIIVDLGDTNPNLFNTDSGIRFMLAPKLHRILEKSNMPIIHGVVSAPGYNLFCTDDLVSMALQFCNLSSIHFKIGGPLFGQ